MGMPFDPGMVRQHYRRMKAAYEGGGGGGLPVAAGV